MSGADAGASEDAQEAAAGVVDGDGVAVVPVPPSQADHPVVLGPFGKSVVGGVDDRQTPSGVDVLLQRLLHRSGPGLTIVVADDDVERPEIRPPAAPGAGFGFLGRTGGSDNLEQTGALQGAAQRLAGLHPVVIVLSVEQKNANLPFPPELAARKEKCKENQTAGPRPDHDRLRLLVSGRTLAPVLDRRPVGNLVREGIVWRHGRPDKSDTNLPRRALNAILRYSGFGETVNRQQANLEKFR